MSDTIAAIATGGGVSAIGIIRISGMTPFLPPTEYFVQKAA